MSDPNGSAGAERGTRLDEVLYRGHGCFRRAHAYLSDSRRKLARITAIVAACVVLAAPLQAVAAASIYGRQKSEPNMIKMGADLLVARPVLFAFTILGSALYVISLPFSLAGGNHDQAAEVLVVGPARATFKRCLGCANSSEKRAGPRTGGIY